MAYGWQLIEYHPETDEVVRMAFVCTHDPNAKKEVVEVASESEGVGEMAVSADMGPD